MWANVLRSYCCMLFCLFTIAIFSIPAVAQSSYPVVPGTGKRISNCGDDFEAEHWKYFPNFPKSSRNIDEEERPPLGTSSNKRWLEGPHRGTPDVLTRVSTPRGGLAGSDYSLLMRSNRPGIPGDVTNEPQQDDLMVKVKRRIGHPIPAEWSPNCVVRVYVPPFSQWENRTGASFGFRTDCWGRRADRENGVSLQDAELEQFWPGLFFNFRSSTQRDIKSDSAYMNVRADLQGRDRRGPELTPGWWTLGLSVSPDGKCHFYARKGVDDLTEDDRLGSYFCYGYRVERLDLFFFNVVTMDNGRSKSTEWIVDDPEFYCDMPESYNRRAVFEAMTGSNNVRPATNDNIFSKMGNMFNRSTGGKKGYRNPKKRPSLFGR